MPTLEEIRNRFAKSTAAARREEERKADEEQKAAEAAEQERLKREARELAERLRKESEEAEEEEAARRRAESERLADEKAKSAARSVRPRAAKLRADEHECEIRHLEYRAGSSRKFWMAGVVGRRLVRRWGRIGTTGQGKWQEFASESQAAAELEALFRRKLAKGYALAHGVEVLAVRFYDDGTVGWRKLPA